MKVLVTGVNGQLGRDVVNALSQRGAEAVASGSSPRYCGVPIASVPYVPMDITQAERVREVLRGVRPDAVIHCAAWTAVDVAEKPENRERVFAVNATGTQYLAENCRDLNCSMTYISTDYVFDGQGKEPWKADCTEFRPLNVYGQSKLAGEQAIRQTLDRFFIVRIAWVFGLNGNNFVKTMLKAAKSHDELRVVNDQIGSPTYTADLARLLCDMTATDKYGCYHATNEGGYISWYDFMREIQRQAGLTVRVAPVTTEEYGLSLATRPRNSRLDKSKLREQGFAHLPDWQDALKRYLKELSNYG